MARTARLFLSGLAQVDRVSAAIAGLRFRLTGVLRGCPGGRSHRLSWRHGRNSANHLGNSLAMHIARMREKLEPVNSAGLSSRALPQSFLSRTAASSKLPRLIAISLPADSPVAAAMPGSTLLYLAQLLRANPLMAIALLICLATILWCILLTRRQRNGLDKMLTGLLGLIAIYEALRILKDSGFAVLLALPNHGRLGGPDQRLPVPGGGLDPEDFQYRPRRYQGSSASGGGR